MDSCVHLSGHRPGRGGSKKAPLRSLRENSETDRSTKTCTEPAQLAIYYRLDLLWKSEGIANDAELKPPELAPEVDVVVVVTEVALDEPSEVAPLF